MALQWLRIDRKLFTHPKTRMLERRLGQAGAWHYLVQLWHWCMDYAPDGRIEHRHLAELIEDAAGWDGEPGRFLTAAVEVGFLDRAGEAIVVHDWMSGIGADVAKANSEAERLRAYRGQKGSRTPRVRRTDEVRPDDERRMENEIQTDPPPASRPEPASESAAAPFEQRKAEARTVFEAFRQRIAPEAKYLIERENKLLEWLSGRKGAAPGERYTAAELLECVEGYAGSGFWAGRNRAQTDLRTFEQVFGSGEGIERGRKLFAAARPPPPPARPPPPLELVNTPEAIPCTVAREKLKTIPRPRFDELAS